ncbi:MAG TPA: flagellar hook-associated protein FlgK [Candidatus Binatia bacterium]|nr:flagellar hook-associated protein FlgK [Candidatus Binatia bacterium]
MSFFGLNLVGNALDSAQVAANVTSDNISNVNTPGASRQVVNLIQAQPVVASPAFITHFGPGTIGEGALVQSITRIHQDSYDTLFRGASTSQNFYQVQQDQLNATQSSLGEPNNGINSALSAFQSAIQSLAANPTDSPTRQNVIQQAQVLVSALNSTGAAIQTQQAQVIQQADATVTKVNGILDQIAALNAQIRASKAVGDNPNTFQDQRDYLIDQLSQLIATQTSVQANGSTLVTVEGLALVNDTIAYHLAPPVVGTDSSGNPVLKVGTVNDPNPVNPTAIPLGSSGQLGAYVDLYNNKLTPYLNNLNAFAAALGNEVDRVTQSGYDQNGNPGAALFQPIVAGTDIAAGNIKVGINDPSQIPAGLTTTAAGTLISAANSANNTIDTSALIDGNVTLNNPPISPAGIQGYLTIGVDGITPSISSVPPVQTFYYNTAAGGDADTIDDFINNFNSGHFGVTASFDVSSQRIVFGRDPSNIDLFHRANEGSLPPTASFTITDYFNNTGAPLPAYSGVPANYTQLSPVGTALASGANAPSLLLALNAGSISTVAQNSVNAFGSGDNGDALALQSIFTSPVGVGALQTTSLNAITAAQVGTQVVIQPPAAQPLAFAQVQVGQVLTVDAQPNPNNLQPPPLPQENVVVTAVDRATGTITAVFSQPHAAGFSITTAQTQTLGQSYGGLVTQIGLDAQTAITGTTTQTNLANSINQTRQSIDGINIDEETQNLVKFQNAYQAAAQNMSIIEQMLQTLITMAQSI